VPVQRINQLMKAVDVFFLPSAWEGIALSIYEAMASGLPVVGADVGGQRELVVANCGVLIQRSTEEAEADEYAKVLSELIRDPVRRKDMGAAGRDRVKTHFTLNKMIECMVELFDGAHSLRTKNPRPAPGVGLGRASAAQLIELSRRCRETEPQWHDRRQDGVPTVALESQHPNWRTRVYEVLRVLYQPLYQRGLRHGGAWYFPMADRVKKALLRHQR
jgi:hypothetical protein